MSTPNNTTHVERNKTALVTGSSSGIGEAIVKELAKLDFKLVVTGRSGQDVRRVADDCERLSPSRRRPLGIVADLAKEQDITRLFETTIEHFNQRLDLLVNNAGLSLSVSHENVAECYKNFKRILEVNLNSACHLSLLAAGPLKRTAELYNNNQATSIVNISSIAAIKPLDDFAYCVSKSGLAMLSNCLAGRLGPATRVNCINPGAIETKIIERCGTPVEQFKALAERVTPLQRIGQAKEIADAVLYLADPNRATYITGAQLTIDGGALCSMIKF